MKSDALLKELSLVESRLAKLSSAIATTEKTWPFKPSITPSAAIMELAEITTRCQRLLGQLQADGYEVVEEIPHMPDAPCEVCNE